MNNYLVNFSEKFISRCQFDKEIILFSKKLCCIPHEEEAAKLFLQYVTDHPDENIDDLHCRVDSEKLEEDWRGNGGGYEYTFKIYKKRPETSKEYEDRITKDENELFDNYKQAIERLTRRFIDLMNLDNCKSSATFENLQKRVGEIIAILPCNEKHLNVSEDGWINAAEQKPKGDANYELRSSETVLFKLYNGLLFIGYYDFLNGVWRADCMSIDKDKVISWHKLPK